MMPRCDKCGRFFRAGAVGSSWLYVPSTDVNSGSEADRCAPCTAKYGRLQDPRYVDGIAYGVVKEDAHA